MQNVHTTLARTSRWKLQRWPTDPSVAYLVFTDFHLVPSVDDFRTARRVALTRGAATMRTSALFPASRAVAIEAGLVPIDQLALLSKALSPSDDHRRDGSDSVRALRSWHLAAAAHTDARAFGIMWANTPRSLHQILSATQRARARFVRRDRLPDTSQVGGFVVSGVSDRTGYLQRLSVDPRWQRQGIGRTLLDDALDWMRRTQVETVFVNTGIDNHPALNLYRSVGFEDTGEVLSVHEATWVGSSDV